MCRGEREELKYSLLGQQSSLVATDTLGGGGGKEEAKDLWLEVDEQFRLKIKLTSLVAADLPLAYSHAVHLLVIRATRVAARAFYTVIDEAAGHWFLFYQERESVSVSLDWLHNS